MKRRITADIEVKISGQDVIEYLRDADPLTRFSTLHHAINGFPDDELRLLVNTYPGGVQKTLQGFQEFCDKVQGLLDFDPSS